MKRPLFAAAVVCVACVWVRLAAGGYENPPPGQTGMESMQPGTSWCITGQVCQKEEDKFWVTSVIVNETFSYQDKLICEPMGNCPDLPLGSRVAVSGIYTPFSGATNPGEFDQALYYRSLGVGGRLRKTEILAVGRRCRKVREGLYRLRLFLRERLYGVLPEREAAVMCALLLGEKGDTDRELKELYKRNGILHILSISSLHITIIGMSLYRLLRRTGLQVVPCALAGGAALVLYGMMTGFSISACRAIGMYLIRMLGEICGRTYDLLTALGMLAAGMVLVNPYYLQNAGFLLSFSSVLGIGAVYPTLVPKEYPARPNRYGENPLLLLLRKILQRLRYAALASLSITLATLPVQLWFYYEIPVWGILLNLLVLPLMKPLLVTGFLSLLPGLGAVAAVDRLVLWWYERLCRLFDHLPLGAWNPGRPGVWQIIVYYGVLACALLLLRFRRKLSKPVDSGRKPGGKGVSSGKRIQGKGSGQQGADRGRKAGRADVCGGIGFGGAGVCGGIGFGRAGACGEAGFWRAAAGVLCAALFAAAIPVLGIRPAAGNRVIFLDVGQGDCCLVQTASGVNYLFDCGSSSRSKIGEYVLLPALKYYGIRRLDGIFLSHPDTDHMNGILELLELAGENHLTVRQLILPAVEERAREEAFGELLAAAGAAGKGREGGVRVGWLGAGDIWDCGEVHFLCLHPVKGYSGAEGNVYSECIYGDFGSFSLLLTGDVEGAGEQALLAELQRLELSGVTVLKTAHHGSRNSTSAELLAQACPQAAVISCGQNNRYGHPHGELLERLEEAGSHVFRTDSGGAVILEAKEEQVVMRHYVQL